MTKTRLLLVLPGLLLMVSAALALQPMESSLLNASTNLGTVYQRYYLAADGVISPGCSTACGASGVNCETATASCKLTWNSAKQGYRGYTENNANWANGGDGKTFFSLFDYATSSAGFYAATGGVVNPGQTDSWFAATCVGTVGSSCLGNATATDASTHPVASTPVGTISNIAGLRPIPVPRVGGYDRATGVISLGWDPAGSMVGDTSQVARYSLFYALSDRSGTTCAIPAFGTGMVALGDFTGTSAQVNVSQLGLGSAPDKCVTFALKLRFLDALATPVYTRFFSANGQTTFLGLGGLAANVTDIAARRVGARAVSISWRTSLEDGLVSFNILRSVNGGAYEQVGTIAAKGTASKYTYMDSKLPVARGPVTAMYKIQTVDTSAAVAEYGPVKADLGAEQHPGRH